MRHTNYDEIADMFDRRYADDDDSGIERALVDFVGPAPRHVLEIGCGTGYWLGQLQKLDISATGIDPSQPMLSRARARLDSSRVLRARAEALPFRKGTFDRLFSFAAYSRRTRPRRRNAPFR